jgi:hypothetical protein
MPVSLFQGKEYRSASRKLTTIGGNDLHRLAGLLAKYGIHRRTWTLLEGSDLESLLTVTSPEPGDDSPSEVSPSIPDEPMLPFHVAPYVSPDESAHLVYHHDSGQYSPSSWVRLFRDA